MVVGYFGRHFLGAQKLVGEVRPGAVYPADFNVGVVGLRALAGQAEVANFCVVARVQQDVR